MSITPAIQVDSPSTDQLTGLTPEQNREWRNTGKLPEPAKTEVAPTSTEEKPAPPAETETHGEPQSSEQPVPQRKSKTAERFEVLTQHNRELKAQLEAMQSQLATLTGKKGEEQTATPAVASKEAKLPEGFTRPKPKIEDYDGSPGKAWEDFTEDLADWKVDLKLAQKDAERQQQERKKEVETKVKSVNDAFEERLKAAEKSTPDIRAKIFSNDVPFNDVTAGFIKTSEKGPEIALKLATEPAELARIQALDPFGVARELTKIEVSLSAQASPVAPARKLTDAPPPAREVGSGVTPPKDELESLAAKDDPGSIRAYLQKANQRDIARKRG